MVAGHALTVVGALDPVTAEEILTDFRLAETVRQLHHEPAGQGVTAAEWLTRARPSCARGRSRPGHQGKGRPGRTPTTGGPKGAAGSSRSG